MTQSSHKKQRVFFSQEGDALSYEGPAGPILLVTAELRQRWHLNPGEDNPSFALTAPMARAVASAFLEAGADFSVLKPTTCPPASRLKVPFLRFGLKNGLNVCLCSSDEITKADVEWLYQQNYDIVIGSTVFWKKDQDGSLALRLEAMPILPNCGERCNSGGIKS